MKIDFKIIKSIFDENEWDVGVLSEEHYDECINSPIKITTHLYGHNLAENPITTYIKNGEKEIRSFLVLAKKSLEPNDYSVYKDSAKILSKSGYNFAPVYLNFKKSAVLSGMGIRAKNSLIYNRKFGFQCKFCMYAIETGEFVNKEEVFLNRELLDLCNGCQDCIINCPAKAINETWIDAKKCDNFIGFGNDPSISSLKWNWWDLVGKYKSKYTEDDIRSWSNYGDSDIVWDGEYKSIEGIVYKNDVPIELKHCRKCQEQPRCSKLPT